MVLVISFFFLSPVFAQGPTIKGKITDVNGLSLPGVSVIEKGTNNGAVTDLDGNFSIKVQSSESVLVFSFLGYVTEEIAVGNQNSINLSMTEDIETLNEVVVVGYGSMQRSNVTGSISTVKADDIARTPVPNVIEAIRGQVAGVRVTRGGGTPGSDVKFSVRGKRSLGAAEDKNNPANNVDANAPLIVVDGVPYSGGKVSDINPNDIASLDILKDASATSIYGSSAANGVILITTKSGTTGKASLNVTFSRGVTDLVQKPELFNGQEYTQYKIDGLEGNPKNKKPLVPESVLDPIELANYNAGNSIDWHDVMLRKGQIYQLGLSLTGGTDKFHYYMNGDLYDETGIVLKSDYKRYSFRLNTDYTPYKFITIGAKTQITLTKADETGTSIYNNKPDFSFYLGDSPLGRIYDSTGALVPTVNGDQFQYNPLYRYAHSDVNRENFRSSISPFIEFKIYKGLTYKVNGFVEVRSEEYTRWLDGEYDVQNIGSNYYKVSMDRNYNYLLDNILNYSNTFFEKHSVNLTGVYGFQYNRGRNLALSVQDNTKNYLGIYDIENTNPTTAKTYVPEYNPGLSGKAYFVGRINYSYDNRYSLTYSRRWDYTSQFGPDKKKGVFDSYAAAWNVSNEKFVQDLPFISNLKYRISWGEVGNDRIPQFRYLYSANNASYIIDGNIVSGWTSGESGNYSLKWETSQQFNTGIDFGFFRNRISGSFDYYKSKNIDILYEEQVPIVFGDANGLIMNNVAETKSWGLGALISGKIIDGDFKWEATLNWSKDVNEIVNLGGKKVDDKGNPIDDPTNGWFIGEDINEIYDYKFIGVYQLGDTALAKARHPDKAYYTAGDPMIADMDGNDTINEKDKTFLGSSVTPKWYGGLSNTFSYKGFELSILIETVQGIKRINGAIGNYTGRGNTIKENYWTPRNPSNDFPQPNSVNGYDYANAVRVQDASFIAIRNISLAYTLPSSLLKKTPIKNAQIYVRGNNLKYFTDYQGYSPESEVNEFPISKTWTAGLNVTF